MSPRAWRNAMLIGLSMWAIVIVTIISCAPAMAATSGRPDPLAVAQTAWKGSPCTNRIRVYWDATLSLRKRAGEASGIIDDGFGNWSLNSCDVAFDPIYYHKSTYVEKLEMQLHEAGHLAMNRHVSTRGFIMSEDHSGCKPLCYLFPVNNAVAAEVRAATVHHRHKKRTHR